MRVLFVTRKFPPSVGGMENFAYDLHRSIDDIVTTDLIKYGGKAKWPLPFVMPLMLLKSMWLLATKKIDIIHMQDGVLSLMGVFLKVIFRKPLVVVIHGLDVTFTNPIFQAWVKFSLNRADSIICISQAAADEVEKRGIDTDKVRVVPIGVDQPGTEIAKDKARKKLEKETGVELQGKKVLLSVGRLVKRKGIAWFVDSVMPTITDKDTILVVSGDGEDREKIDALIEKHNLEDRVFMLGRTSDEVRDLLWYASDVFIMPNIKVPGDMEGFGIVLVEAASCGLPVVASAMEGILDATKDGKNAVHVEPENAKAFAKTVSEVAANPDKYSASFKKYTHKHYSWPVVGQQYVDSYTELS